MFPVVPDEYWDRDYIMSSMWTNFHKWDGEFDRPTFCPSAKVMGGIDDDGNDQVLYHGFIIDGRMGTDLKELLRLAPKEKAEWYKARK